MSGGADTCHKRTMKILLSNWAHKKDQVGGTETVYGYLKQAFPESELISGEDFKEDSKDCIDWIKKMDFYYSERYRTRRESMLLIRDAEFGGFYDISHIPQIAIFQNPYKLINERVVRTNHLWVTDLFAKNFKVKKTIATTNFMANEMKKNYGIVADHVVPNCVDTDLFKPKEKEKLREKYKIPKDQKVGIWIGMPNIIKNFQTILDLVEARKDIFWILISKTILSSPYRHTKIVCSLPHKLVNEFLNCADFFILTSPVEGCNLTALEAMACDIPCILTKTGYFWDFWDKDIGLLVNWDSFDEHLKAIDKIFEIETHPRKVLLKQKLDFNTWKNKWEEIIEEIKNG